MFQIVKNFLKGEVKKSSWVLYTISYHYEVPPGMTWPWGRGWAWWRSAGAPALCRWSWGCPAGSAWSSPCRAAWEGCWWCWWCRHWGAPPLSPPSPPPPPAAGAQGPAGTSRLSPVLVDDPIKIFSINKTNKVWKPLVANAHAQVQRYQSHTGSMAHAHIEVWCDWLTQWPTAVKAWVAICN